ncbi:MAG: thiaminase II, partial [Gemmatimonadetes bacterium]|nr:thiaminase II [Gemmatimonadota bacterium]
MDESFTKRLYSLAEPILEAQYEHPFVRGIADGTLDLERFKFWIRQDYLFLVDYARLLALAIVRAPGLPAMRHFADLAQSTLNVEMELHRSYAAEFGITEQELEKEEKAPTTRGYTDFLLRVASTGEFSELTAGLLPCIWGFSELGQRLARSRPAEERYARWIDMYSSVEFAEQAAWCRQLVE